MKRRVISFITGLALCLSLCPTWALADNKNVTLTQDTPGVGYIITYPMRFDAGGYTYTASSAVAISIQGGGNVYLTNGTVKSEKGAGVEVKSGGSLGIEDTGVTVIGTTYGLDVFSGTTVQLSGGKYIATGEDGMAVHVENNGYGALLKSGYAFFDEGNDPIPLTEVAGKTTVTVQKCTNHLYRYTTSDSALEHNWECLACGAEGTESCAFDFDTNGRAECADCGHRFDITIAPDEEAYDGTSKPDDFTVRFQLDGKEITLFEDSDYTVDYTPIVDFGETLITVTGATWSFEKTFRVTQAQPVISWKVNTKSVDYDGSPIEEADLPEVNITDVYDGDLEALKSSVQFSYKKTHDGNGAAVDGEVFTDRPPTDAGTYEIMATLPGTQNYYAADTAPNNLTLTIEKISPFIDDDFPKAETLTYNGRAQKLVDPGTVWPGVVIQFKQGVGGTWSENIPIAVDAGEYPVWYKIDATNNFTAVGETKIKDEEDETNEPVKIQRKTITPIVELDYDTCVYDGGEKRPAVTVRDKDNYNDPLPRTEYEVYYYNNTDVGTATVIVTDTKAQDGNYAIVPPEKQEDEEKPEVPEEHEGPDGVVVTFEITPMDQDALTITNKPNTVSYGDEFTLSTSGGSGDGDVTWEIIAAVDAAGNPIEDKNDFAKAAEIDPASGQVTVHGLGKVTVQATKSDGEGGNHKDATAVWTFTAGPKRVNATVTASGKTYDGDAGADITAVVEKGDLVSTDKIEIKNVKGTFSDANVGTGKTVTVDIGEADIEIPKDSSGNELYIVTIPTTPVRADITRAETIITTIPTGKDRTYDGNAEDLVEAGTAYLAAQAPSDSSEQEAEDQGKNGTVTVLLEYALSENGSYSTVIPQAADAGSYEVWYRVRETGNYFGTTAKSVTVTISKKSVTAYVTLDQASYAYDGKAKEPAVTVRETDANGKVILPSEYTVAYSNNTNAGKAKTVAEDGTEIKFDPDAPAVTVAAKEDGNYTFTTVQKNFEITTGGKAELTKPPQANNPTYNGQEQELVTAGAASGGQLVYALANEYKDGTPVPNTGSTSNPPSSTAYGTEIPKGKDAGEYIVFYKAVGDGNYEDSGVSYVFVTIRPKTVTSPIIELPTNKTFTYSGNEQKFADNEITVKDGDEEINSTEYTVTYSNNVNAGTATIHINDKNGGNYDVSGSTTFEIGKATAAFTTQPQSAVPTGQAALIYSGKAQTLIKAGVADGGTAVYALGDENGPYSETLPTGTDATTYTVYAKVRGDANHDDSVLTAPIFVTISPKPVTPKVTCSPSVFPYDGTEKTPNIIVTDADGVEIPASEYTVDFGTEQRVAVKTYTVTVKARSGGNYKFIGSDGNSANGRGSFEIVSADQAPLSIVVSGSLNVCYGDTFRLSTVGGSGTGAVKWSISCIPEGIAQIGETSGIVTVNGVGSFTVTAQKEGPTDGSYGQSNEDSVTFTANPKPVTAVVTAASRDYDGTVNATLTVSVPGTDLTGISGVTGAFADANVGTGKTVNITVGNVGASGGTIGNYDITWPATTTADITPKVITPTVTVAADTYTYTGTAITPVVTVTFTGETLAPERDKDYTVTYSDNTNVGTATVTVRNVPGGNYTINAAKTFTIEKADVDKAKVTAPTGKTGLTYTGAAQALISRGSSPDGTMVYSLDSISYSEDVPTAVAAGEYFVYYKVQGDSNHKDSSPVAVMVEIRKADQNPLTIIDKPGGLICYNDHFTLSTSGGSGSGAVTWEYSGTAATVDSSTGLVKVEGVGDVTITATKAGGQNYNNVSATWTFTVSQAAAEWDAVPERASGLIYTGEALQLLISGAATVNGIGKVEYSLDKETWQDTIPTAINAGTYTVWYRVADDADGNWKGIAPDYVEVEIKKAMPTFSPEQLTVSCTSEQTKLSEISLNSITPSVEGTFAWVDDGDTQLVSGQSYEVIFTPKDTDNYNTVTIQITVTFTEPAPEEGNPNTGSTGSGTPSTGSGANTPSTTKPGPESPSTQTTVRNGAASTVLNTAAGDELVDEAVANQSENVVIKPEITGDVTKTEVSIPAPAVGRISRETNAALTVSTPVADVTIPNAALGTLSGTSGAVSIVTERAENSVVLTLTADGKDVGDIPLTLTVPMEDFGPGTVAVLVYEDGTRETIRKSVAGEDGVRIPLNGSATVEIVDNSKEFTDVSAENWAADAVAFASAHELFIGTAEATFSPNLSISRAMLATVLHNLEGNPDQSLTDVFNDIGSGAWYEESVSWAAANGIVIGYGSGQFGPNDSVTREQIAVMLWRYAGSPAADKQILDFMDADQVSGYAMDAMYWATANGILNGFGNGYLAPGGLATRAQTAQMMKNFLENT